MSFKPILIHSCKRPNWDKGQPIVGCSCQRRVTRQRAKRLVESGRAAWKKTIEGMADFQSILVYPVHANIPIPRAKTIGERHILRALGASLTSGEEVSIARAAYERRRIEIYPEVTEMSDRALLRKRAALTQVELSHKVGISAPRLCLWERGYIELRPEQMERIASVLKESLRNTPYFDEVGELVSVLAPSPCGVVEVA